MEQKTKLLLAEDDENLGLLLKEYLVAKGYDANLYPDGEAAYKGFMREHYDICILDIMMPKKDGFTLAGDIRKINSKVENIVYKQADLLNLPKELINSSDSVSSLHAIEHFGLGRYGDPIDYYGHERAIENIYKILKENGKFYFSVENRIFNFFLT